MTLNMIWKHGKKKETYLVEVKLKSRSREIVQKILDISLKGIMIVVSLAMVIALANQVYLMYIGDPEAKAFVTTVGVAGGAVFFIGYCFIKLIDWIYEL